MAYLYVHKASGLTIHKGQKAHEQMSYIRGMEHGMELGVRATLECCGGCTITWADRGDNQSMNNKHKYNKGGSHLTEGKTREKSLRFPHCR